MRVAITGSSGYLGRKVISVLEGEPAVSQVLGIDLVPPALSSPKLTFARMDVRGPTMAGSLRRAGIDCLVHLAWIFNPSHNHQLMFDVDVNGTRNVMATCLQAGIKHFVMVGSTTCYGAYPDNPPLLTEDAPLRGNPSFPYAHHKVLVERLCDKFERDNSQVCLTRLRTCIVLGRNVDNFVRALVLIRGLRHIQVKGHNPSLQFLHEDDFATLLRLVLLRRPRGIFNVAPDDAISVQEIAEMSHNPIYKYPYWLVRALAGLLWSLRLLPTPASYLPFIAYPWTASNAKVKAELGWQPVHSSREALASVPGM